MAVMARSAKVRSGWVWHVLVRSVMVGLGAAVRVRCVSVRQGPTRQVTAVEDGKVGMSWCGWVRFGGAAEASSGWAGLDWARQANFG